MTGHHNLSARMVTKHESGYLGTRFYHLRRLLFIINLNNNIMEKVFISDRELMQFRHMGHTIFCTNSVIKAKEGEGIWLHSETVFCMGVTHKYSKAVFECQSVIAGYGVDNDSLVVFTVRRG